MGFLGFALEIHVQSDMQIPLPLSVLGNKWSTITKNLLGAVKDFPLTLRKDEEFHIPQGLAYCKFNFSTWDPKITTLPGLYVLSTILLGPLNLCDTYSLRFVNYLTGLINISLFYMWFSIVGKNVPEYQKLLSSFNLSILPPLYFFNNLYYTDVVSIMSITLLLIANKLDKHILASICGLISVTIRQTNIIWVAMLFGDYVLKQFYHYCIKTKSNKRRRYEITENDIKELGFHHLMKIFHLRNIPKETWLNIYSYFATLSIFVIFLIYNGGVVVGDKTAHTSVIHVPQFFYFSLFCLIFAWPHFLRFVIPFFKFISRNILRTTTTLIMMVIIIHLNTLVHPYLLADNRHYTFYIWNRFYEKIFIFRYIMAPVYLFGVYSIINIIHLKKDVTFALVYLPCTFIVLILQRMIEVRYFLIPFVLMRLRIINSTNKSLLLELFMHIIINFLSFKVFFEKDIYWSNFNYPQKLIW